MVKTDIKLEIYSSVMNLKNIGYTIQAIAIWPEPQIGEFGSLGNH